MTKKRIEKTGTVPPQLLGVHLDAVAIGATAFGLEPNPPCIMASFAAGNQPTEIDFRGSKGDIQPGEKAPEGASARRNEKGDEKRQA